MLFHLPPQVAFFIADFHEEERRRRLPIKADTAKRPMPGRQLFAVAPR